MQNISRIFGSFFIFILSIQYMNGMKSPLVRRPATEARIEKNSKQSNLSLQEFVGTLIQNYTNLPEAAISKSENAFDGYSQAVRNLEKNYSFLQSLILRSWFIDEMEQEELQSVLCQGFDAAFVASGDRNKILKESVDKARYRLKKLIIEGRPQDFEKLKQVVLRTPPAVNKLLGKDSKGYVSELMPNVRDEDPTKILEPCIRRAICGYNRDLCAISSDPSKFIQKLNNRYKDIKSSVFFRILPEFPQIEVVSIYDNLFDRLYLSLWEADSDTLVFPDKKLIKEVSDQIKDSPDRIDNEAFLKQIDALPSAIKTILKSRIIEQAVAITAAPADFSKGIRNIAVHNNEVVLVREDGVVELYRVEQSNSSAYMSAIGTIKPDLSKGKNTIIAIDDEHLISTNQCLGEIEVRSLNGKGSPMTLQLTAGPLISIDVRGSAIVACSREAIYEIPDLYEYDAPKGTRFLSHKIINIRQVKFINKGVFGHSTSNGTLFIREFGGEIIRELDNAEATSSTSSFGVTPNGTLLCLGNNLSYVENILNNSIALAFVKARNWNRLRYMQPFGDNTILGSNQNTLYIYDATTLDRRLCIPTPSESIREIASVDSEGIGKRIALVLAENQLLLVSVPNFKESIASWSGTSNKTTEKKNKISS